MADTKEPCRDSDCPCVHGENVHGEVIKSVMQQWLDTYGETAFRQDPNCECMYCEAFRAGNR